jgi:hypothetical protein
VTASAPFPARHMLRRCAIRSALCALALPLPGPALAERGEPLGPRIEVGAGSALPAVASNAAGEFVVAWREIAGGPVMARRYAADGTAAGDAFVVGFNPSERAPAIAMNASGAFVISWTTPRTQVLPLLVGGTVRPGRVLARRYAPGGVALGEAFEVAAEGDEADVAIDDDGDFVIGWAVDGNRGRASLFVPIGYLPIVDLDLAFAGVDRIAVRRYAADGTAFAPQVVDRQAELLGRGASGVSVAMDVDGDHAVVWSRRLNRERSAIVAQRFDASGVAVGRELAISASPVTGRDRAATTDAAMSQIGTLAVIWMPELSFSPSRSARIAIYSPDNTIRAAEFAVGPDDGSLALRPKLASDSVGNLHVVAGGSGPSAQLQTRLLADNGVPLGPVMPVLPAPLVTFPEFSAISIDGAGVAAIAHVSFTGDGSGGRLGVQRFQGP